MSHFNFSAALFLLSLLSELFAESTYLLIAPGVGPVGILDRIL